MKNNEENKLDVVPIEEYNNVVKTEDVVNIDNNLVIPQEEVIKQENEGLNQVKLENVEQQKASQQQAEGQVILQPVNNTVVNNEKEVEEKVVNTPSNSDNGSNNNLENPNNNSLNNANGNESKPSKFKTFMAILLFIFFFAFVYFLPEITNFINEKKNESLQEEITTGRLVCNLEKDTSDLDVSINAIFQFTNSEITKLTFTTTSKGDESIDKEQLEKLKNNCNLLKNEVVKYDGVSIVCSLNNGINTTKQILDYEKLDAEKVSASYAEAGGVYPEFEINEQISSVESKMVSSGYECERTE